MSAKMRLPISVAFIFLLAVPASSKMYRPPASFDAPTKALEEIDRRVMPPADNALLRAAALKSESEELGAPYQFAHPFSVDWGLDNSGTWEELPDGTRLWRLRISSPGAQNLNLGFSRFDLPANAGLWIYNLEGDYVEGPYTARHRSRKGRLYTPILPYDELVVELAVPAGATGPLDVRLEGVHHGFRDLEKNHGACNIDVICPEGDAWRDQIRSVARYTGQGITFCTGQLVNNTAEDDRPFFLSAFHCGITEDNDDTLVFYWNFEAPVCGQQDGGDLTENQTGSIYRAGEATNDFVLVEMTQMPDPEFDVYYAGWDRSGEGPQGTVGIHHPQGDVKSISFNDDTLGTVGWNPVNRIVIPDGVTHWEVDNWEQGTTEGGSSGSCIFDPESKYCIGVLTGGRASCAAPDEFDIYGKLSTAWESVGDTPATRLRDWLDPLGLGLMTLAGKNPGTTPSGACVPSDTVLCLQDRRFQVEVSRTTFAGPGPARVVPVSNDESGLFWFFDADNWEMLLKVLDGCVINNHFWVFAASATDVEWAITVTDTQSDVSKQYFHLTGTPSPAITDTAAFATCP